MNGSCVLTTARLAPTAAITHARVTGGISVIHCSTGCAMVDPLLAGFFVDEVDQKLALVIRSRGETIYGAGANRSKMSTLDGDRATYKGVWACRGGGCPTRSLFSLNRANLALPSFALSSSFIRSTQIQPRALRQREWHKASARVKDMRCMDRKAPKNLAL